MKNELTLEEVGDIKKLEGLGYDIDELTEAIVSSRQFDTYIDIKAQIKRLFK
jgi:hypothetical protein